jgi:hypothetical protein
LEKHGKWARVHFIPNLKDGEFVTLRAPYVLNLAPKVGLKEDFGFKAP